MAGSVKTGNIVLGEGRPKICIPITDNNIEGIKASLVTLKQGPFDLVEWRGDAFAEVKDAAKREEAFELLHKELGEAPVLFTIRTDREMGGYSISDEEYLSLNLEVIESGLADLVDVELSRGEYIFTKIVAAAREKGVKIIGSCHKSDHTPSREDIVDTLVTMQKYGADIAKYAAMPQCERDVMNILEATLDMKESHNETPVITMSMGPMGAVSRVCGSLTGSCLSFGTAGKASAPGQLPAGDLDRFLDLL